MVPSFAVEVVRPKLSDRLAERHLIITRF